VQGKGERTASEWENQAQSVSVCRLARSCSTGVNSLTAYYSLFVVWVDLGVCKYYYYCKSLVGFGRSLRAARLATRSPWTRFAFASMPCDTIRCDRCVCVCVSRTWKFWYLCVCDICTQAVSIREMRHLLCTVKLLSRVCCSN